MALGDGQGPPLGVLHLVESGSLWAFIRFFPFYFIGFNFWDSDLAGFYAHRIFCHLFVYGRVT